MPLERDVRLALDELIEFIQRFEVDENGDILSGKYKRFIYRGKRGGENFYFLDPVVQWLLDKYDKDPIRVTYTLGVQVEVIGNRKFGLEGAFVVLPEELIEVIASVLPISDEARREAKRFKYAVAIMEDDAEFRDVSFFTSRKEAEAEWNRFVVKPVEKMYERLIEEESYENPYSPREVKEIVERAARLGITFFGSPLSRLNDADRVKYLKDATGITINVQTVSDTVHSVEVEGNTYPYRNLLKEMGYKFSGNRWYKDIQGPDVMTAIGDAAEEAILTLRAIAKHLGWTGW